MRKRLNVMLLMVAMILGLSAVSPVLSQEQARAVTIGRDTKVGGKALEKGSYTLKFVEGKEGELVFLHGKHEVVKASYETTKLISRLGTKMTFFTLLPARLWRTLSSASAAARTSVSPESAAIRISDRSFPLIWTA